MKQTKKYFKLIIIDFTCVQFIDEFAFKCLEKIHFKKRISEYF